MSGAERGSLEAWTVVQDWVDDIRLEVSVCSCHCHENSRPNEEILVEKIDAALAAEREAGRREGEKEARKDAARFVRTCLADHVEEWAIDLVEQGILMPPPDRALVGAGREGK